MSLRGKRLSMMADSHWDLVGFCGENEEDGVLFLGLNNLW